MIRAAATAIILTGVFAAPAAAEYNKSLEQAALDCLPKQVDKFDDLISEADVVSSAVLEECGNMLHPRAEPFVGNDLLDLQNWQKIGRPLALQAVLVSRVKARAAK